MSNSTYSSINCADWLHVICFNTHLVWFQHLRNKCVYSSSSSANKMKVCFMVSETLTRVSSCSLDFLFWPLAAGLGASFCRPTAWSSSGLRLHESFSRSAVFTSSLCVSSAFTHTHGCRHCSFFKQACVGLHCHYALVDLDISAIFAVLVKRRVVYFCVCIRGTNGNHTKWFGFKTVHNEQQQRFQGKRFCIY